jgi:hypothetical protein
VERTKARDSGLLGATEKTWKGPPPQPSKPSKPRETSIKGSFEGFEGAPPGPSQNIFGEFLPAPPLPPADAEAIQEALKERAAIREFEAGELRAAAERAARTGMRVYRVRVAMGADEAPRWLTLLAPGCDLDEAETLVHGRFGPERILEIHEYQRTTP